MSFEPEIPQRPRLKPYVALAQVGPEAVLLKGPALFLSYTGEAVPALLRLVPLLDGTRDLHTLAREADLSEEDARDLVAALVEDRAVEEAAGDDALRLDAQERARLAPQLGLWSHLTREGARVQNRLADARVLVVGAGSVHALLAQMLHDAGVGEVIERELEDASISAEDARPLLRGLDHAVLAFDEPRRATFLAFNDAALAEDARWTGVFLDGLEASIGPTVVPWQTACWRCYDLRVKGAHPNLERLLTWEAREQPPAARVGLDAWAPIAAGWAAQAVLLTLGRAVAPPLAGEVMRARFLDFRAERHRVLRIPRCPACSRGDIPDVDRYNLDPVSLS